MSDVLLPATSFDISCALGLRPQNDVSAPSQLYRTILCFSIGISDTEFAAEILHTC